MNTIPIVLVNVTDPVGQGFVESLAHPGGNITGFTDYDPPMAGKWLGMLTQITPPVARVAVLFRRFNAYTSIIKSNMEERTATVPTAINRIPARYSRGRR